MNKEVKDENIKKLEQKLNEFTEKHYKSKEERDFDHEYFAGMLTALEILGFEVNTRPKNEETMRGIRYIIK